MMAPAKRGHGSKSGYYDVKYRGAPSYTTVGPDRGPCGHVHYSIWPAVKCMMKDRGWCRVRGIQSDRQVVRSDGRDLTDDELESLIRNIQWELYGPLGRPKDRTHKEGYITFG
jgi:hypothetical protein